jgi:hypothetical protein
VSGVYVILIIYLLQAAVTLLINESCQPTGEITHNIDKYLPLWRDLFDSRAGKDAIVVQGVRHVFGDVMDYVITVLQAVLDEGVEVRMVLINMHIYNRMLYSHVFVCS